MSPITTVLATSDFASDGPRGGPEGTAPVSVLPEQLSRQAGFASSRIRIEQD